MFRKVRRRVPASQKPEDEKKIETEAYLAVRKTRTQLRRAASILDDEVRRLDAVLGKNP
jgi:hypothetical protein